MKTPHHSAPLIGIPTRYDNSGMYANRPIQAQNDAYLQAVQDAGGIPFMIPLGLKETSLRGLFDMADGILLSGGGDIDPSHYGQAPHPSLSDVQPERDRTEIILSRWAAAEGKPILGICRGFQVMGVAAGGNMYQDVFTLRDNTQKHSFFDNSGKPRNYLAHNVVLDDTCRLARIFGETSFLVNSLHHQAVKEIPAPYRVVGHASDGVNEALELPNHPFFCGVQWHPEELTKNTPQAPLLFQAFIQACQQASFALA